MSKKIYIKFLLSIFLLTATIVYAQQLGTKSLQEKIAENQQLLITDSDKAFSQINILLKQAKKERNKEGELTLLSHRSWYLIDKDLKEAINATQELQAKAKEYRNDYYQASAHIHFSYIYAVSELPDKALKEFELSIKLLNRINNRSKIQDIIFLKVNAYTAAATAYKQKKAHIEAAQILSKANGEIKKIEDSEKKRLLLRTNYTNLGGVYAEINVDSAEHFINQSLLLSNEDSKQDDMIQFDNYFLLGYINKEKKDYVKAIYNYKEAESKISDINSSLERISFIYRNLAEIYKNTDSLEQANHYLQQLQHSLLKQEQNKNQSLHKIIDEELLKEKNYSLYIIVGVSVLLLISLVFIFRLYKRNNLLAKQEKISEQYLKENKNVTESVDDITLSRLIVMLKDNDPAFMITFRGVFPEFTDKIQAVHPKIVQTELEFCTMMKLNLPTKEIAKILNIEPKSVQAKKYRIRRKLNIPNEVDIYMWFNQL